MKNRTYMIEGFVNCYYFMSNFIYFDGLEDEEIYPNLRELYYRILKT